MVEAAILSKYHNALVAQDKNWNNSDIILERPF